MTKHCSRCDGYGIIKSYSNVMGGTCFKCGGRNTRGNWQEVEKKARKERYTKKKRIEKLEKSITAKEILVNNFDIESEEEKQIYNKWVNQLNEMKLEYKELNNIEYQSPL